MAELNSSPGKSGGKRSTRKMPVRVDLTAMVDLAFLLITFFMLTTSLTKPRIMPVVMPAEGPPGPVSDKTTMTICLGKNNQALWFLGMAEKPLTTPKLTAYGQDLRMAILETQKNVFASTGKGLMVLIKPTDHSIYDNLVSALDEVNITHVPSYAIAKIAPQDIDLLNQKEYIEGVGKVSKVRKVRKSGKIFLFICHCERSVAISSPCMNVVLIRQA